MFKRGRSVCCAARFRVMLRQLQPPDAITPALANFQTARLAAREARGHDKILLAATRLCLFAIATAWLAMTKIGAIPSRHWK